MFLTFNIFKIHPKPDATPEIKIVHGKSEVQWNFHKTAVRKITAQTTCMFESTLKNVYRSDLHFIVDEKDEDKSWWKNMLNML